MHCGTCSPRAWGAGHAGPRSLRGRGWEAVLAGKDAAWLLGSRAGRPRGRGWGLPQPLLLPRAGPQPLHPIAPSRPAAGLPRSVLPSRARTPTLWGSAPPPTRVRVRAARGPGCGVRRGGQVSPGASRAERRGLPDLGNSDCARPPPSLEPLEDRGGSSEGSARSDPGAQRVRSRTRAGGVRARPHGTGPRGGQQPSS